MDGSDQEVKLSSQQQRVLKLLFKFRFISAQLLARVMGISRPGAYQALESLLDKKLVNKVYEVNSRIDRKPAYYYLNKQGVTFVRRLMDVRESVVHTLYKNDSASPEFVQHYMAIAYCYTSLAKLLPTETEIFTKSEINQDQVFPKNRPDLYLRTPDGREAVIVIMDDKPLYIARKRLDEIIQHSEDGEWDGDYPRIGFILKNSNDKNSFLYSTRKKLDGMGMDEEEIHVLATQMKTFEEKYDRIWSNAFNPKSSVRLFE